MNKDDRPPSNLELLHQEVLSGPPEAALPSLLPDHWLDQIAHDLEMSIGDGAGTADTQTSYAAAPLVLIIHLLCGKADCSHQEISVMQMLEYFRCYEIEIALEMLNRRTNLNAESATLETIFTDRTVMIAEKHLEAFRSRGHLNLMN